MSNPEIAIVWTAEDVAERLKMSISWVRKRTADGTLPHVRFGAAVRYTPSEITEYAKRPARQK